MRPSNLPAALAGGGIVVIGVYCTGLMWAITNTPYNIWGAMLVAPALFLITLPLAMRAAEAESDPWFVRVIMIALAAKLLGSVVRYWVAFSLYDGSADASMYYRTGWDIAESYRQGIFWVADGVGGAGTVFMRKLTGAILAVIGPTRVGAFLVFAWLGFWGLYFFFRAFRLAVPGGDVRRYALLVFFMPSLLFWPSSVGKEAWMILTLGIGAYGAARVLTRRHGGYVLLALGLAGAAAVRPHMSALLMAGMAAAYLLRRSSGTALAPATRVIGAAVVLAALLLTVQEAERRFGVEGEGLAGAEQAIDDAAQRTDQGGSEYEAARPDSVGDVPKAAFAVLFRPLPHEAHNAQALVTSLEGLFLLVLCVASWRRLATAPRHLWRSPYVALACVYSLLFILAFSSFGNFGILARQRAQVLPFFLILLALPRAKPALQRLPRARLKG